MKEGIKKILNIILGIILLLVILFVLILLSGVRNQENKNKETVNQTNKVVVESKYRKDLHRSFYLIHMFLVQILSYSLVVYLIY